MGHGPSQRKGPDLAAGGSGPSLGSILTLLVIAGGSLGAVTYLTVKIKKGESLTK